jgi:protein phosphatase PTC7
LILSLQVQEHAFNTPFQLGLLPGSDTADMGLGYSLGLAPGDVLVAGSDGLFDNMWDDQLEALVERRIRWGGCGLKAPGHHAADAMSRTHAAPSTCACAAGHHVC